MHELKNYVCDELKDLERKAERGEKLTMNEIQYADTLAHLWKDILTSEAMEDSEYSHNYSYARGRKRDSMGRYSRRGYSMNDNMMAELHELMNEAPDEKTRGEFKRFIDKMERM